MTRREALYVLTAALLLVVGGLTWQFGPWGLIGSGVGIAALVLFGVDVKERHEAVASPPRARGPVHVPRPR